MASHVRPILGVMLRCHQRVKTLSIVLDELRRYHRDLGIEIRIAALLDRPTPSVKHVLARHSDLIQTQRNCPFPILSPAGIRFREAKRAHYADVAALRPDWILLQDDDRWFEPVKISSELYDKLVSDVDLLYAKSVFFWDQLDRVHPTRYHASPTLFRHKPGNQFPLDQDVQAPQPLHDQAIIQNRIAGIEAPLLDYGSFSASERERIWAAFKEAGKDDEYTRALLGPIRTVPAVRFLPYDWRDLYTESLK